MREPIGALVAEELRLVHAVPGRVRLHLPGSSGQGLRHAEVQLRQMPGVRSARANPLTGNVLVYFDPAATHEQAVRRAASSSLKEVSEQDEDNRTLDLPPALQERLEEKTRARIAVRGLDRDPGLAHRIVERLEHRPGVQRATANPLTGRVLVEFVGPASTLDDLLADVADSELPALPGEDRPTHPLESGPLVRNATRAGAAALGLGFLAVRRLVGAEGPPVQAAGPVAVAGAIGLLQGFPAALNGLRRMLGPNVVDAGLGTAGVVSLTLAGSPLGLALGGLQAARLLTEVLARRAAWRRHESLWERHSLAQPGAVIRVEAGERAPLTAKVREGIGVAVGRDGLPMVVNPGSTIPAGAPLYGGPFVLDLGSGDPFTPQARPSPITPSIHTRYLRAMEPLSLAYAVATTLLTRSPARALAALLLVNPLPAVVGMGAANAGASARVLRSGVTVVGTRPDRPVRLPGILLIDGPRVLTEGFELAGVVPLIEGIEAEEIQARAAAIAVASGSPWHGAFHGASSVPATDGAFDGRTATAIVEGICHTLGPIEDLDQVPAAVLLRHRGDHLLILHREGEPRPLCLLALRPRLAAGVAELSRVCQRHRVEIGLLTGGNPVTARGVAERASVSLLEPDDLMKTIRARQARGTVVAVVSDTAEAAEAFAACDLAIGLAPGGGYLPARADLLAPDLGAVAAVMEAGAYREAAVRDAVALSAAANAVGTVWNFRSRPSIEGTGYAVYLATFGAIASGWTRLRGGERPIPTVSGIADPHPERWSRHSAAAVLKVFDSTEAGLTSTQAAERRQIIAPVPRHNRLLRAVIDQLRSPLTGILAAGAGLSLILGAPADVVMIGAMVVANAAAGAWQESRANQAAEALARMGTVTTRVLRDGQAKVVPGDELVPGDVMLLVAGDRVAADARLLEADGLEVDEASLTGESLPVWKAPDGLTDGNRVVLEGSDVVAGTGQAVVVAVGRETRMGATAAALAIEDSGPSPLDTRLNRMLRQVLPVAAAGGGIVMGSGLIRGGSPLAHLAVGASIAIAAVPEGLPLLARIGEAAVARRLSRRRALVHRLAAVEALGRVDVACTDKTGTLTEGRLKLRLAADFTQEFWLPGTLPEDLRHVLLTAVLAGPHPDALDAAADRTDVAVVQGALEAGLGDELRMEREAHLPFDSARSFHAAVVRGRLCIEGAAEALVSRCDWVRRDGEEYLLDEAGRDALLTQARHLAARGLRVLMVAEGPSDVPMEDPRRLIALGLLGLSDPLRANVAAAVVRCHNAGVRVIMITGDHPATARAIADEAGLPTDDDRILTGVEVAGFDDAELDRRLKHATIIARAKPLDKLRIVQGLQRLGHTVAMTGDGINDGPALRLADVGVAMGEGGTEVARQAADVVLTDDDFSTLVEALVEGRSFWRNLRRALGLLLGGNLGELGLQVGVSLLGLAAPLTSRQILAVNLITDVLPALAVALQQPEHHNLSGLAREGTSALGTPLRNDILRRGATTAAPALAAHLIALRFGGLSLARTVAFASIVTTQLAQTLDVGRSEGGLSRSVLGAVTGSTGILVATLAIRPLRAFLMLGIPGPLGMALIGGATLAALLLGRGLASPWSIGLAGALRPARLEERHV